MNWDLLSLGETSLRGKEAELMGLLSWFMGSLTGHRHTELFTLRADLFTYLICHWEESLLFGWQSCWHIYQQPVPSLFPSAGSAATCISPLQMSSCRLMVSVRLFSPSSLQVLTACWEASLAGPAFFFRGSIFPAYPFLSSLDYVCLECSYHNSK